MMIRSIRHIRTANNIILKNINSKRVLLNNLNRNKLNASKPLSTLVAWPDIDYLKNEINEGSNVEIIPKDKVNLIITDNATKQLLNISNRESNNKVGLRILIDSGGCHGYQYNLELVDDHTSSLNEDD